jgi:hypothetical protein
MSKLYILLWALIELSLVGMFKLLTFIDAMFNIYKEMKPPPNPEAGILMGGGKREGWGGKELCWRRYE